jgi:hypothetical protein
VYRRRAIHSFEEALGTTATGVDNTLRNAFMVEVKNFLAEVKSSMSAGPLAPSRNVF